MKYYIFKVTDTADNIYYILNNQYIGYIDFDTERIRSLLEWNAKIEKIYQLYAVSSETGNQDLHKLNCDSYRFDKSEIEKLVNKTKIFKLSTDKTMYKVYFPNKNSSECYLKEIGGEKTIKDLK